MGSWLSRLRSPEHAVLSLGVQATMARNDREQGQFEVLVRHLLDRFFNNELMSTDGETTRAVQAGYMIALPGLLVALFLFASYHLPGADRRGFWPQVSDHYFYVMYSMVVMGVVTVYEWDLLFPDLLEVFVLSVLPIRERRLFLARVLALGIFLAQVLVGTNFLGALFLPLVADLPSFWTHLFAHITAVAMGGFFASGLFLMLQGVLLNVVGERVFRRITPLLQGGPITALLTVLLLFPLLSHYLKALLTSGNLAVQWFPPFWFLGIYERLLHGQAALPIFKMLARSGCEATLLTTVTVLVTYPLAYRRRVRQLIEGSGSTDTRSWLGRPIHALLHASVLRLPARRAVFHFVSQTLLRTQKHRVLLAMYGGLGIAFALAEMVVLRIDGSEVRVGFLATGIRAAVPVLAFWAVAGLRTALAAPADRRGSWVFRVIQGRPTLENLNGAKTWVVSWGLAISLLAVAVLRTVAPDGLRSPLATVGQIVVALGLCVLLTDFLFMKTLAIPFTEFRKASTTDMPLVFVRYFVMFPVLVLTILDLEPWIETNIWHLIRVAVLILVAHLWWRWRYRERVREWRLGSDFEDTDQLFQGLGLKDP
jgi:hypothetical protein